ncbi:MAG TPA: DUF4154 domain-containing protein [Janthinobacterium sp.]|nr:DUF4154 domain-containing protein [Janthinobacterium sp.]
MRFKRAPAPLAALDLALRLALLAALCLAPPQALAQTAAVPEYELKAAFVFNFAVFAVWPAENLGGGAGMTLCAYAGNSLLPALMALNDKVANGHKVAVRVLAPPSAPSACQILVLDSLDRERWSRLRRELGDAAVLTVADDAVIGNEGAAIALSVDAHRIGFDVDLSALRQARLSLSSKLLRLARSVQ